MYRKKTVSHILMLTIDIGKAKFIIYNETLSEYRMM